MVAFGEIHVCIKKGQITTGLYGAIGKFVGPAVSDIAPSQEIKSGGTQESWMIHAFSSPLDQHIS